MYALHSYSSQQKYQEISDTAMHYIATALNKNISKSQMQVCIT